MAEWLRRQTVNLLEIPSLVRIQLYSYEYAVVAQLAEHYVKASSRLV